MCDALFQDLGLLEKRLGKDMVRAPRENLEERRKRVREVWKTVEKFPAVAWEVTVVKGCEKMMGDVLRGEFSLVRLA